MYILRANKLLQWRPMTVFIMVLGVVSCATTNNTYFPASAAERAADRIIEQVLGGDDHAQIPVPSQDTRRDDGHLSWSSGGQVLRVVVAALSMMSTDAYAVGPPRGAIGDISRPPMLHRTTESGGGSRLNISDPAITTILSSMQQRHDRLSEYYEVGAIGYNSNALVAVRDMNVVSSAQRAELEELILEENRDRDALYREIARVNGHPQWEAQVRDTFSRRWIAKAPSGWYYHNSSGVWKEK